MTDVFLVGQNLPDDAAAPPSITFAPDPFRVEPLGNLTLLEYHWQIVNWMLCNDHPYARHLCQNMLLGCFHQIMLQEEEETETEGDSENEDTSEASNKTLLNPFHYLELIGGCTICGHIDFWGTRCVLCHSEVIGGEQFDYEDEVI